MSAPYDSLAATALRLLTKFGRTVTLRRVAPGAYDTGTSQAAAPTSDFSFKGALLDIKEGIFKVDETLVQAGDKQLLLEPAAAPTVNDTFIVGGTPWQAVGVPQEVNPAGTVVLYAVHLRR